MCLTRVIRVSYWTHVPSLPVFGCLVGSPVVCPPCSLAAAVSEQTADVWLWIVATDMSALPHFHVRINCSNATVARCAEVHSWPVFLHTEQCL